MPYLEVKGTKGTKRLEISEADALTIGRHKDNVLVLADEEASRHHCVIEPHDGAFRVRDLSSSNGTRLNQDRLEGEEVLDHGDILRIGRTEMRFIDPAQSTTRKRRDTPDFAGAARGTKDESHELDIDLREVAGDVQTNYEHRLREIIDAAADTPFDETDISLVDTRGVTLHQATAAGLESGTEEETGEGIRVFCLLLLACFRSRATDLHVEPRLDGALIRLRVDGYMLSAVEISATLHRRLLGVVKILCQIDTSLKSTVQDGHFSVAVKGRRVDYRVSLTPAMQGQKLVVRVLDSANAPSHLHELGMMPWMYEKLRTIATKDAGMLLACGPTGSGKTTSLYSCLREIDVEKRNAITIEDPVEYYLDGCTQIPIDHKQGNTFANILRSVLRQDPDVIFVGEIRDLETATVAMQAAMTGHLVYTTVHSKDSIGAIFRLMDLGVEPGLVANALNLIVAQRLVRLLCKECRKSAPPTPAQNMKMKHRLAGVPHIHTPTGCSTCLRTGFIGRRALFELLEFNDQMRDAVLKEPTIQGIRGIAEQGLFVSLQDYGYQLVAEGLTSMEEIDRVAGSE